MTTVAVVAFVVSLSGWEVYCRTVEWLEPSLRNSDGLWVMTHDRLEREGGGVAIVGSSRVMFDINLDTWQAVTGYLPIQLALEGTSSRPFLTHVAQETSFKGLLVVGVTEFLFFPPEPGIRAGLLERHKTWSPADRASQWLSMHLVEPFVAFYDPDYALFRIVRRQPWWPTRRDMTPPLPEVRKLSMAKRTRHNAMWARVERDPAYQKLARDIWLLYLSAPRPEVPPEAMAKHMAAVMAQAKADVAAIRARGGDVVFVRAPSTGPFLDIEHKAFPREGLWTQLLAAADAAGVHFEEHADLQGFDLPEWSHIAAGQTDAFTRALIPHLRAALDKRGTPRPEVAEAGR